MAILGNVVHELLVLLGRPQPPPQLLLVAARLLRHAGQSVGVVGAPRRQPSEPTTLTTIDRYMEAEI